MNSQASGFLKLYHIFQGSTKLNVVGGVSSESDGSSFAPYPAPNGLTVAADL